MKRENVLLKMIFSKIFFILLFLLLINLAIVTFKTTPKHYKINKEVSNLKKEIFDLEKQKNELTQLIEYLDTLSFKEKEARTKLGLQKEGEKTIIITAPYSNSKNEDEIKEEKKEPPFFNFFRWWKYFFSKNNQPLIPSNGADGRN